MQKLVLALIAGSLVIPAAVVAGLNNEKVGDPNRVICRSDTDIGSRLARSRRCHTAAEWAQIRREERLTVDRVQQMKTTEDTHR